MTNPARPAPGAALANLADIPEGGAIVLEFRAGEALFSLILARTGATVAAFENVCPHLGFPLERPDGRVVVIDGAIVCAAHGACFGLLTGAMLGGPGPDRPLRSVAVDVRDGVVVVA